MRIAGLDFETANKRSGSICAAGCAVLENGQLVESGAWRIFPHKGYRWMLPEFTEIHGLHYWDVKDAPEFPAVWPELSRMLLSADCVIIHNAPFDLGHLLSVLQLYQLPPVTFNYADSVRITRKLYPEMKSHSLNAVAEKFAIAFRHHDALEDASTCAEIISRINIPDGFVWHFSTENEQ